MIRHSWICFVLFAVFGFASVSADDLQTLDSDTTQLYAKHLVEVFEKQNPTRAAKFEVDVALAKGLHSDEDGIILVPAKGMKDDTIDPAVETEQGAGLCYLFLSPCYAPITDGKAIDAKQLHRIKFKNGQGVDQDAICLVVTVKHKGGDDWRLYGFGGEKSPVINSEFGLSSANVESPLALSVGPAKNKKADVTLTLFKKYAASFPITGK